MALINLSNHRTLANSLFKADTFWKRFKGLMFTKELSADCGLQIHPCRSIHTFFMNYTIDVLYLDDKNRVIAIDHKMKPYKLGKYYKASQSVIELPAGRASETNTNIGDQLEIQH
ncbi:hypothetical protein BHU72_11630 [Desulfuribacillus stibiiarsenatis]|uniref:DUF192 domain-containing protein n=1 Tax=Desulfuribacillus stibiiarsenatis TaxID=1390249 RepID=A0A1E5L7R9_9FIRM|nr:DUF192 domain-containing protein [Desulfuribacillus stibiiarsenatis]OEH86181.1 hypothetical protein BHU72_11630 [Desulfuribacillus stibiiarsenatis]